MQTFNILVVEDDQSVQNLIANTLKVQGYAFTTVGSAKEAIQQSLSQRPSLVLLDLGLPDKDGIEVIKSIRSWSTLPIIVISARGEEADKIQALDTGADDYLTKPFSVGELLARIRVAQRRQNNPREEDKDNHLFQNGDLCIDYEASLVTCQGEALHLTATEYKILKLLSQNVGKVLTYSLLIREIWGSGIDSDIVSLRVHVATLRKKLGDSGREEPLIQTHVGIGYQMNKF